MTAGRDAGTVDADGLGAGGADVAGTAVTGTSTTSRVIDLTVPHGALHGPQTAALARRVQALDDALVVGGHRLDPPVVARVAATVDGVRERLELGVDQTVVALVGGTGSGKSSLFNAVCGLEFADVGVKRPTTSAITACVWGSDGAPLLDWLGVDDDRRIERESALDGDAEAPLRGLVLLDLPDHDSVAPEHREVVDAVLPQADLLLWVVDPQKYADDALHTGYLRGLVGHEASMAVVLNQVDTVPEEVRPDLAADVSRLLVEDGLTGVPVHQTSARTGEGIAGLRAMLTEVVGARSLAAQRAGAEVRDAAGLLAGQVADREPGPAALGTHDVVERLAGAAGLAAVAGAVAAVVRGRSVQPPAFGPVQEDAVRLARTAWCETTTGGLPRVWAQDVAARVSDASRLRAAVTDALSRVAVVTRRSRWATVLFALALLLLVAGAVTGAVAVGTALGAGRAYPWAPAVAVGLVVLAGLAALGGMVTRRAAAQRRSEVVLRDGRAALEQVAREHLVEPTAQVLAEHRRVRELAAAARG